MTNFFKKIYYYFRVEIYWFVFKLFKKKPKVMTPEQTINLIIKNNLSVSRFGDGEFRLMSERGEIGFQRADARLAKRLKESFSCREEKIIICSYNFNLRRPMNVPSGRWLKKFVYRYYDFFDFFDFDYLYGDTDISRFYQPDCYFKTNYEYLEKKYIPLLKKIWENHKILIVEGEETKLGLGNDLFTNVISIRRIICPKENAFSKYDEIKKSVIKNIRSDEIVIIALGPTASILAVDLCKLKIRAIDIGHIDVVYMWFKDRAREKKNIEGKYVNEATNLSGIIHLKEKNIVGEIVDEIV